MSFITFFIYFTITLLIYLFIFYLVYKFIYKPRKEQENPILKLNDLIDSMNNNSIDHQFWEESNSNDFLKEVK